MKLILVIGACLCGLALIIKLDTGTLEVFQVAGIGIICAALAHVAPS